MDCIYRIILKQKCLFLLNLRFLSNSCVKNTKVILINYDNCFTEFEKAWEIVVKDKLKRNGVEDIHNKLRLNKQTTENLNLDMKGQLQILSEIKNSVNENNNLIKKRIDNDNTERGSDDIHVLAEKNFSELSKLSILADCSLKMLNGLDSNRQKQDLNSIENSENVQKEVKPDTSKPNTPDVSKDVSVKTPNEPSASNTDQPESMAEPHKVPNSEYEWYCYSCMLRKTKPWVFLTCHTDDKSVLSWPGIDEIIRSYNHFIFGMYSFCINI